MMRSLPELQKYSVAFRRLRAYTRQRNGLDTKLQVYKAVVQLTLLYGCETWTEFQRHAKSLMQPRYGPSPFSLLCSLLLKDLTFIFMNHFHLSYLRTLLKIKWQDKIPDTQVLKKAEIHSLHTVLKLMSDERLPNKVFYGELQEGKHSQGDQKKSYKDTLKASLKEFDIPLGSWEQTAKGRSK